MAIGTQLRVAYAVVAVQRECVVAIVALGDVNDLAPIHRCRIVNREGNARSLDADRHRATAEINLRVSFEIDHAGACCAGRDDLVGSGCLLEDVATNVGRIRLEIDAERLEWCAGI